MKRIIIGLLSAFALSGCSNFVKPDDPNYAPIYPAHIEEKEPVKGSIYLASEGLSLYEDIKAHRVGDIITVILSERTDASKTGETKTEKSTTATVADPTILGTMPDFGLSKILPVPLQTTDNLNLEASLSSDTDFEGKGESKQNNKLTGTITVTVTKVLPNGNLFVRGEKWININQGDEFIRLSGVIRSQDISPHNTVTSDRIANARIAYSGRGAVNDSNAPGWLTRLITHWLWPL